MLHPSLRAKDFLVADSGAMRAVLEQVEQYADGDAPVLIVGEHGTGRELVARVLHQRGPRTGGRFVAVRPTFEDVPGRVPTDDACERARRALRAAAGGTLLVKDMSDLSAPSQRTLKRAIRDRKSDDRRARSSAEGGAEVDRKPDDRRARTSAGVGAEVTRKNESDAEVFDVHVVATGDLDVDRAVDAKIVARDFYTLFEPRRITVPPLRDRLDDLPALFSRWVKHYAVEIDRSVPSISSRAIQRLTAYPWPGNVGELKSIARRLVVRVTRAKIEAGDVDEILPVVAARVPLEDLAFEEMVKAKLAGLLARIDGYPVHDLYEKVLGRVERPLFDLVLAHTGGNQLKAAEILGLNRNTLRKKLAELGMQSRRKRSGREDRALDGD